ncbi:MAG: hypothetical protein QNL33_14685 [Akkermansiaceae bacterium]
MPKGDWLALALKDEGARTVTIDFLLPGRAGEGFRFNAVAATASDLTVLGEADSPIKLSGVQADSKDPGRYYLPSSGGEVIASRAVVRDEKVSTKPTDWEAITESLVTSEPDVLRVRTRLQLLTSDAEPGSMAQVRLPRLPTIWYLSPMGEKGRRVIQPSISDIKVALNYEPKKKGLLWHRTYGVDFSGSYENPNPTPIAQTIYVSFPLPSWTSSYQDFAFSLGEQGTENQTIPRW